MNLSPASITRITVSASVLSFIPSSKLGTPKLNYNASSPYNTCYVSHLDESHSCRIRTNSCLSPKLSWINKYILNSGDLKDEKVQIIGHIKNNLRLEELSSYIEFSVFLPFSLASLKVLSPEDHPMLLVTLISGHRHWS